MIMLGFATTSQLNNDGLESVGGPGAFKKRSICKGCSQEIYDQYILRVTPDLEWHQACLKCVDCQRYLDERCTCFVRDGKPYCKPDYIRLFLPKCAKCNRTFEKLDYVMRVRNCIYHTECFHCIVCRSPLRPGDEFALREEGLFCKADHEILEKNSVTLSCDTRISYVPPPAQGRLTPLHNRNGQTPPLGALTPLTPPGQTSPSQGLLGGGCAAPSSISGSNPSPAISDHTTSCGSTATATHHHVGGHAMHGGGGGHHGGHQKKDKKDKPKTTRVRTVLNEKQLHTLRTCYAANPRPDALMKEQLVEMTGLSPRVIRVWFQNKRCKDKKKQIAMKQMQQQQEKNQALNGIRLHGVGPLIAGNASRHDMPMVQSMDVQQYQQNAAIWGKQQSLLHEYTHIPPDHMLSLESQQTPFQQLMHGFGDPNADPTTLGYHHLSTSLAYATSSMDADLRSISPHLAPSDLSSPSCSE